MLFSPTIGAAITAPYWFLWVRCPACRTINAIDLRTLDRHRDAAVSSLIPALSCSVFMSNTGIYGIRRQSHRPGYVGCPLCAISGHRPFHSTTASARRRNGSGIVIPSALAVPKADSCTAAKSTLATKINLLVIVLSVRLALRDYFHARLMSVSDNCKLQMMGSAAQLRKAIPQKPAGPRRANSQPDTMVNNAVVPPIPTVP